jgi:hypothetical protein
MIGLESHYRECINVIETHVKKFTVDKLEEMNKSEKQAGVEALKWENFKKSSHVSSLKSKCSPLPTNLIS